MGEIKNDLKDGQNNDVEVTDEGFDVSLENEGSNAIVIGIASM